MYESTGQYGQSSLRKVRLEDGKVLAQRKLGPKFFGEGLGAGRRAPDSTHVALGFAFVSDLSTLEARETLSYRGEGWGLCYDGTALVMSDGSSMLEFRDPESMELLGEVSGVEERTPRAEAQRARVRGLGDLREHLAARRDHPDRSQERACHRDDRRKRLLSREEARRADVLNGIAYKPESKTFLLTGKLWPHVFEVELVPR